jgi:hypothetical protein
MQPTDFEITVHGEYWNARKSITKTGLERLIKHYQTQLECSHALGISHNTLIRWENRHGIYWPKDSTKAQYRINHEPFTDDGKLLWERRLEEQLKVRAKWENYSGKTTIFSCPHFPFADYDRLEEMIRREKGDLGRLVIAGDITDFHGLSLFKKEYHISPLTELKHAINGINQLKNYSESILLMRANHDARYEKRLAERLSVGERELMEEITNKIGPIQYIAEQAEIESTDYWFIQLGDVFIVHPESGLSGKLRTAQRACDFAVVRWPSINAVVCGHTHAVGSAIYRTKVISEIGCMSRIMDYTLGGRIGPAATDLMYNAYFRAIYDAGHLDIFNSGYKYLGPAQ